MLLVHRVTHSALTSCAPSAQSESPTLLSHRFFPRGRDHWGALRGAPGLVKSFVAAAHSEGWGVVAYIDAATQTAEAARKWRARRVQEVGSEAPALLGLAGRASC